MAKDSNLALQRLISTSTSLSTMDYSSMPTCCPQQENLLWQGLNVFSSRPVAIFAFSPLDSA